MKLYRKIESGLSIINSRITGKKIPVAVRFQITRECPLDCPYCNYSRQKVEELSTEEIIEALKELARLGCTTISFSGGEPLIRPDVEAIFKASRELGISGSINTNGAFFEKRLEAVKHLDLIKFSLDGPEEAHDLIRGKNSFKMLIKAVDAAKREGLFFTFATTIVSNNVERYREILELAQKYDTMVAFQPLKRLYRGVEDFEGASPDPALYRKMILALIEEKRRGNPHIRNTIRGLYHILNWPVYPRLECCSGRIFFIIEADGTIMPCDRIGYGDFELPNIRGNSIEKAIEELPELSCNGCGFCGALELNYFYNFKFDILPVLNKVAGRD